MSEMTMIKKVIQYLEQVNIDVLLDNITITIFILSMVIALITITALFICDY
ncbi:hypothetical protein [Lactobacillus sp.]|uniref:hypothetical protein n=1 Tax=Lactobacillus sp. TaxID=1591 RepID=UPI0025E97A78|nr:hypothetical protein [Lactobacillus sp.]